MVLPTEIEVPGVMNNWFHGKFGVHFIGGGQDSSLRDTASRAGQSEGSLNRTLPTVAKLGLAAACALGLAACVTPQERHAMDQNQCYAFGFEPDTDGFAECMMGLHQQRAVAQANSNLYWQAQLAEQNRRREARQDLYKIASLQRSGDPRFPICGASSDGGMDRRTMTWYGPNCRAR
ncbi:hypothetical protein MCBMB27_04562 [Methylobacterium phyllosphaerae]|jgi:hypothetical protein|uniref:Uncharacterized protein n=2 Tax=Methylobacterium TaxID=407 RepID=A0AAE8L957_9HYPH|nr:protein of unassigned function [Methylobacterium oryzae CBMB20]APT33853.1 hypothetical protein MCBMB27_04562 [Methylobacterium phyllosphaerae]SFH56490.1 hypothetical protein SAMN05192567_13233 [Methylobacterium phyllosphaerae]SFV09226.1 hypothetical protein SAMN02799643_05046 [Methylobacterium sp. UNCCL125]